MRWRLTSAGPYHHLRARSVMSRSAAFSSAQFCHRSNAPLISVLYRRKLNLKAKFEGGSSYYSCKRVVPGAFNMGFIGSTCAALPCSAFVR